MSKPAASIVLPIRDYATQIEDEMSHLLVGSLPGLYTQASRDVVAITEYQGLIGGRVNREESQIVSGIDDGDGRITFELPKEFHAPSYERSRGSVGVCLIKDYVNLAIDNTLVWVHHARRKANLSITVPFREIMDAYLVHPEDENASLYCEERVRGLLQDLTQEVYSFIGEDNWHIYHTSQVGLDLRIDKVIDYRIHEYTRLKREGVI